MKGKEFCNIQVKMPVLESLFNKVAVIQRATSSKKLTPVQIFTVNFAKLLIVFYIHPSTTASERALDFTKNFSIFKASCEKEFILLFFSYFSLYLFPSRSRSGRE